MITLMPDKVHSFIFKEPCLIISGLFVVGVFAFFPNLKRLWYQRIVEFYLICTAHFHQQFDMNNSQEPEKLISLSFFLVITFKYPQHRNQLS